MSYVELHCHSAYSLRDGASSPEELVLRARELGYEALALTDHDGLYGAMAFAQAGKAWGVRPIVGAEITLGDLPPPQGSKGPPVLLGTLRPSLKGRGSGPPRSPSLEGRGVTLHRSVTGDEAGHLTLLVADSRGYANLCRIITHAYARSKDDPRVEPAFLAEHTDGLIALSGCRKGEVPRLLAQGCEAEAEAAARRYREWFGADHFVLELQRNYVQGDAARVRRLLALGRRLGLRVVATNNVHYHVRERHRLQDVLVAIRHRRTLDACHQQRLPNDEFHLKPPAEMAALFADLPQAVAETLRIAERCTFDLTRDLGYRFPDFRNERGEPADEALARVCREALAQKYDGRDPDLRRRAEARLEEELRLVRRHGLSGFFLVYRDLLELAREVAAEVRGEQSARALGNLPPGRGRGSSVSSIICYLIGLSHVDPVQTNLFLGRFLNEELHSVPDIDLDFPRDIREKLIERVVERYGREHAALVCAFATYRMRSAVRDIGKALGLPEADIDKLAKVGEGHHARDVAGEIARLPDLAAKQEAPAWRHLAELAEAIDGLPRHVTQHVGGMIVSSRPLVEIVPVEPARMAGRYLCQWDKDSCDDARFIKVDFLALGMLSLVEECLELIVAQGKPPLDLSRIDYTDQRVYDAICRGDTIGMFQVESRAQIQMLPRVQPRTLADLAVQVALVRPGPIVGGAVNPYVTRRAEERAQRRFRPGQPYRPRYDHPSLEPALRDTLGIIVFQDQVLEVAMALAGFSAAQAESLRRAMSRRRSREAMESFWQEFREGAARRGVDEATAQRVFRKLVAFSEFGFPKSHAAAFAVLAYQSAWLRLYYPVEFVCALLNNQPMGFYTPDVVIHDAQRHGLAVLRPEINQSGAKCTVEEGALRLGLGYVAEVGQQRAEQIVAERERGGRFRSLGDFVRRLPGLSREATENLIRVGAFDGFGLRRRELLWQLGLYVRPRGEQMALSLPVEQDMVRLPEETAWERMAADYELMQLSPTYHPIGQLRRALGPGVVSAARLARLPSGERVTLAGLVVCRQRPGTAKGFVFLLLEDETGLANVVVRPSLYEARRELVRLEPFVLVEGVLEKREGTINILASEIRPITWKAARPGLASAPPPAVEDLPLPLLAPPAHNFH